MTFSERMFNQLGTIHHYTAPEWRNQANCLDADPDIFFATKGEAWETVAERAREWCDPCPVRSECLEFGRTEPDGIWGGKTPKERRKQCDEPSNGGYYRHMRRGEVPCAGCSEKRSQYVAAWAKEQRRTA